VSKLVDIVHSDSNDKKNERNANIDGQIKYEDEEVLIKSLKRGDEEAYRYLYRVYGPKIGTLVKGYLGTDDVDDVIQEVFMRIYRSIKKFRGDSKLSTWIYRISINVCNNVYKKFKGKEVLIELNDTNDDEDYRQQFSTDEDIEKEVTDEILYDKVRGIIDKFNPEDRAILFMKEIDGMTYEEIGKVLDKPEGTVKSRLHYIKDKLKKAIEEALPNE